MDLCCTHEKWVGSDEKTSGDNKEGRRKRERSEHKSNKPPMERVIRLVGGGGVSRADKGRGYLLTLVSAAAAPLPRLVLQRGRKESYESASGLHIVQCRYPPSHACMAAIIQHPTVSRSSR